MTSDRHRRLTDSFRKACEMTATDRAEFLEQLGHEDPSFRAELERLLEYDSDAGSVQELPSPWVDDVPTEGTAETEILPERIGKFRVIRALGHGGMGRVYLAEQESPRRIIALKVLPTEWSTPQKHARFAIEADALGRLQHPHIAQIYESGFISTPQGNQPYLAMEYVEGETLMDHAQSHRLNDSARLELLVQICDAVHHAHQKGVIHRDLKPANILVTADHQTKILDFGIARLTDRDIEATTLRTHRGDLIGTIPYMSPEQAAGNVQELDTRSDVYALGVIGYELLSGKLPYNVAQRLIHEAIQVVQHQSPDQLSRIRPQLRGDVETIIGKALEKEPARRYQSACEMADDIRRFLEDQPIMARPPSAIYQLRKFARRNAVLVGSSLAVVAALLIGIVGMSVLAMRLARQLEVSRQLQAAELAARQQADADRRAAEESVAVQTAISQFLQDVFAAGSPYVGNQNMTVADALDLAAQRVEERLSDQPEAARAVRWRLSDTYSTLGKLPQAIEQLNAALAEAKEAKSEDPEALAAIHACLGDMYSQSGKPDLAESHLQAAMRWVEDPRCQDEPLRALTLSNYAALLIGQEDFETALPMLQKSLEIRLRLFGEDHPYTMTVRNNMAVALNRAGRLPEAEEHTRKNMESHRRILGDKHPNTITGIYNYADLLRDMGRLDESEKHFTLCLQLAREHLPTRHFLVGQYHSGFGELLRVKGQYAESDAELRLAHSILSEQLGKEHPRTQKTIGRLMQLYEDWGRPEEAAQWKSEQISDSPKTPPANK